MRSRGSGFVVAGLCCVLLLASGAAWAQRPEREAVKQAQDDPRVFLEIVRSYLTMVDQIRELNGDPLATLIVALHDIKEIYQEKNDLDGAVKEFRGLLKDLRSPAARAVVRRTIADMYREAGHPDKALAELRLIVAESVERLDTPK
jgi:hypothetical protein